MPGGNLTCGHVGPILGMVGKGTMRDELMALLEVPDNDMIGRVGVAHDMQRAKTVLTEFIHHENIEVYLQTMAADALVEDHRVTGVVISSFEDSLAACSGLLALEGKVVVDATGDGDVAAFAGCQIEKGREDGLMQPVTLEFTLDNVDEDRGVICIGDVDDVEFNGQRFLDYCKQCAQKGMLPEHLAAVRLHPTVHKGERQVNTTQANGVDSTKIEDLYPAELALRGQIDTLIRFFRENLPGYENCKYIASGTTTGIRESRRVVGEYLITAEELAAGKRFDDVVVHRAEFIVDIHNPAGAGQAEEKIQYVVPYDLPYGCFVPKGVDGLMTAGRCISGTHRAHASYRVMSICMAMGQAVGVAAALCARQGCQPRELDVKALQKELAALGVELFD